MTVGLLGGAHTADVDETARPGGLGGVDLVAGALEVDFFECPALAAVLDGRVRKLDGVYDDVGAAHGDGERLRVAHVSGAGFDVVPEACADLAEIPAEHGNLLTAMQQLANDGRTYESRTAGYQDHRDTSL